MPANDAARYEFGRNWSEFAKTIGERDVRSAEAQLRTMLLRDDLSGLSFLDIGCGSGLHALARAAAEPTGTACPKPGASKGKV